MQLCLCDGEMHASSKWLLLPKQPERCTLMCDRGMSFKRDHGGGGGCLLLCSESLKFSLYLCYMLYKLNENQLLTCLF